MNKVNEEKKKINVRRNAIIIASIALLISIAILAITKCAIIDEIKGAPISEHILNEEVGAFVETNVSTILGFYAEDVGIYEAVTGRYAVVPVEGGKFITVAFTNRYLEKADAVLEDTYAYINYKRPERAASVSVQGTVLKLNEKKSAQMYEWFALEESKLVEAGVITHTDDFADYLSDTVLLVDTVNSISTSVVWLLSLLALACFLYGGFTFFLVVVGYYSKENEPDDIFEHMTGSRSDEKYCEDEVCDVDKVNSDIEKNVEDKNHPYEFADESKKNINNIKTENAENAEDNK